MTVAGLSTLYRVLSMQSRRKTGGGSFSDPSDISGLQLWLDFSDTSTLYQDAAKTTPVTANDDPVGCVEDKSGNSRDLTQTTSGYKPLYKTNIQNSLGMARFDSGDDELTRASFDYAWVLGSGTNTTIFVVIKNLVTRIAAPQIQLGTAAGTRYLTILAYTDGNTYFDCANATTARLSAGTDLFLTNAYIFSGVRDGANMEFWRNAGSIASRSDASGSATGTDTFKLYRCYLDLGELIIYNAALTTTEIGQVRTYLNDKWSVY